RIAGEPTRTVRYLDDVVRLQPPNIERASTLFTTALFANGLDARAQELLGTRIQAGAPGVPEELRSSHQRYLREDAPNGAIAGKADAEKHKEAFDLDKAEAKPRSNAGDVRGAILAPNKLTSPQKRALALGDLNDSKSVDFFALERKEAGV